MRQIFAITAGLILSAQTFAIAQNPNSEALKTLQAVRNELDGLRKELQTMKQNCGIDTVDRSATISSSSRQMILRMCKCVHSPSVAASQQILSSGLATSGVSTFQAASFATQNQLTFAPSSIGLQSAPLVSNFATTGFTTGLSTNFGGGAVRAQSFTPLSSNNVLPASPYVAHQSYGAYSNGTVTQSLSAGAAAAPVYPTATFRGTGGFVNAVPAPYYSVY
jgi:hypothetical protein